jgi:hypothetical protein
MAFPPWPPPDPTASPPGPHPEQVPIRKQYGKALRVPDQSKCVQIAHLGHGVVPMRNVARLPETTLLVMRINQLQAEVGRRLGGWGGRGGWALEPI